MTQDQKGSDEILKGGLKEKRSAASGAASAEGPISPAKIPEIALPAAQQDLRKQQLDAAVDAQALALAAALQQPLERLPQAPVPAPTQQPQQAAAAVAVPVKDGIASVLDRAAPESKITAGRRNTPTTEREMIEGSSMRELLAAANRQLPVGRDKADPRMQGGVKTAVRGPAEPTALQHGEPNVLEMAAFLDAIQGQPRPSEKSSQNVPAAKPVAPPAVGADLLSSAVAAMALPVEVLAVENRREAAPPLLGGADLLAFLSSLRDDGELALELAAADPTAWDSFVVHQQGSDLTIKNAHPEAALVMNTAVVAAPTQTTDLRNQWELATVAHELARNGGGTVRLSVKPEGMGEITMSVTQGAGKEGRKELALQIVAQSAQARDLLVQGMGGLSQALKSKDYDLKSFDVALQDGGTVAAFTAAVIDRVSGMDAGLSGADFASARDGASQRQEQGRGQGNAWERYEQQAQNREQRGGRRPWETWLAS
mgnify:FL=1